MKKEETEIDDTPEIISLGSEISLHEENSTVLMDIKDFLSK
jgi:hypothetical protein